MASQSGRVRSSVCDVECVNNRNDRSISVRKTELVPVLSDCTHDHQTEGLPTVRNPLRSHITHMLAVFSLQSISYHSQFLGRSVYSLARLGSHFTISLPLLRQSAFDVRAESPASGIGIQRYMQNLSPEAGSPADAECAFIMASM